LRDQGCQPSEPELPGRTAVGKPPESTTAR
jgi:hypothetical protein